MKLDMKFYPLKAYINNRRQPLTQHRLSSSKKIRMKITFVSLSILLVLTVGCSEAQPTLETIADTLKRSVGDKLDEISRMIHEDNLRNEGESHERRLK
ncbi:unnamed protein product [Trichobilharzia szidati]|nr:unnamed protein product [Trichobilharzia szidati]